MAIKWLLPGADAGFVLLRIRGQMIFVDPATKLVMVHTAVRPKAVDRTASQRLSVQADTMLFPGLGADHEAGAIS